MRIQFRTLTFHSGPEEQIQQCLHLKKSMISLLAAIEALCSPLELNPESDLATDLYSDSTPKAIMDESDRQISFNESVTLLSAAIRALGSPLGLHPESDLVTDVNSDSTPIAIMDESNRRISFNSLKKFTISLSTMIGALSSPLGPCPERELAIDLYSSSTPIAIKTSPIVGSVSDDFKKVQYFYKR
jgi:hypothetical protein